MIQNIHAALSSGATRPVVIGEYPYYRADPAHWRDNLHQLRQLGVDVISCYLPWRFHEIGEGAERTFDFTGKTDPQRNVTGLLEHAADAGLRVLLKPGPFIHAEVQLGGFPDRLCTAPHTPYRGLNGQLLTSQGQPLPSLFEAEARAEAQTWLRAVAEGVVTPALAAGGPIAALQIGNEGICGDAQLPIDAQDAGPAARAAFVQWLTGRGHHDEAASVESNPSTWPAALRISWSQWAGQAIVDLWDWIASLFPAGVPTVVNVPLPPVTGHDAVLDAWASRCRAIDSSRHLVGHTEWVGNPAADPTAFQAHLAGALLGSPDVLEANWGFTWTDHSFADARTPVFNTLLALMLGSSTVSVYTACATSSWGDLVDMDSDGLLKEGVDPALHHPPYCPGAPLNESGRLNSTADGLTRLSAFLERFGDVLLDSELETRTEVLVDRALAEAGAWQHDEQTVLQELATAVYGQLVRRSRLIGLAWLDESGSPSLEPAMIIRAERTTPEATGKEHELVLPPGRSPGGAVAAFLDALPPDYGTPEATWSSEKGHAVVLHRIGRSGSVDIVGAFNSSPESDQVDGVNRDRKWRVVLPPGTAAVAVVREGELLGWVATPAAPDARGPELVWDGSPAEHMEVF